MLDMGDGCRYQFVLEIRKDMGYDNLELLQEMCNQLKQVRAAFLSNNDIAKIHAV